MNCQIQECKFYDQDAKENCIRSSNQTQQCLSDESRPFFQLRDNLLLKARNENKTIKP
jgi:hypothetical protein